MKEWYNEDDNKRKEYYVYDISERR
jgi:hypothetical protein